MKKILVVDDEYAVAKLIKLELQSRGYSVEFALSGAEAFQKLKTFIPDVITMDIMMPDLNGFQVFELLSKDEKYKKIPVIFISVVVGGGNSLLSNENRNRALEMGAAAAIPKPVNFDKLTKLIEQCIN